MLIGHSTENRSKRREKWQTIERQMFKECKGERMRWTFGAQL